MIKCLTALQSFLWGAPALVLILGVGVYLSIGTKFAQIRLFPASMRMFANKIFLRKRKYDIYRQTDQDRYRHQQIPPDLRFIPEQGQCNLHCTHPIRPNHNQRPGVLIPGSRKFQHCQRSQHRFSKRQINA